MKENKNMNPQNESEKITKGTEEEIVSDMVIINGHLIDDIGLRNVLLLEEIDDEGIVIITNILDDSPDAIIMVLARAPMDKKYTSFFENKPVIVYTNTPDEWFEDLLNGFKTSLTEKGIVKEVDKEKMDRYIKTSNDNESDIPIFTVYSRDERIEIINHHLLKEFSNYELSITFIKGLVTNQLGISKEHFEHLLSKDVVEEGFLEVLIIPQGSLDDEYRQRFMDRGTIIFTGSDDNKHFELWENSPDEFEEWLKSI